MSSAKNNSPILLQAPGMGLPKLELFAARVLVRAKALVTSRSDVAEILEHEKNEILKLVKELDPSLCSKQVLIKRLRGLEDSSRFWSIYMTIDHLRIVNSEIAELIKSLSDGHAHKRNVSIAAVKPEVSADAKTIPEFENSCKLLQDTVLKIDNLKTQATWPHPWFGKFNAAQWYFLAAFHMNLHRKQMLLIQGQLR